MSTSNFCMIAAIVIYLLLMLAVGFIFSKNNRNTEDFYLGGRKLGPFVTAMSAEASDMSSWLLMGLPGLAYLTGVAGPAWTAIGLAIGTWANWYFVAKRLRIYSADIHAFTIPDFFSRRYHDNRNILNGIAATIIIVFFVPYTASGFAACGKLFQSLFGVDYRVAMIVSAAVIVGYTIMGGFRAVSTTDMIQSVVMTLALTAVVIYGIQSAGGIQAVMENAKAIPGYLSLTSEGNVFERSVKDYSPLTIASTLAWGLGYFGMPHILLRFMAISDEKKLVLSRRIASAWVVVAMGISIFIGMIGYGMTSAGNLDKLEGTTSETVIVKIAELISRNGIGFAALAGVILAGILAATMSTADSQMLAAASSVSQNLIQDCLGRKISEKKGIIIARLTIIAISIIALFIAWNPKSSVFRIVSFSWAGFGGAFGAAMLLALFWKRSNCTGVLFAMISGGLTVFVWKYAVSPLGGLFAIYELLPAFVVSLLVGIVVSLLTKCPDEDIRKEFDSVQTQCRH